MAKFVKPDKAGCGEVLGCRQVVRVLTSNVGWARRFRARIRSLDAPTFLLYERVYLQKRRKPTVHKYRIIDSCYLAISLGRA